MTIPQLLAAEIGYPTMDARRDRTCSPSDEEPEIIRPRALVMKRSYFPYM
jgi:hypothetical protein